MIKLGDEVECLITGFKGIAVSKEEYLNGCLQFQVQPKIDKDGKLPDSAYIDEQQLFVIKHKEDIDEEPPTGGGKRKHAPKKR